MATTDKHVANLPSTKEANMLHLLHSHSHHQLWSRRHFLRASGLLAGIGAVGFPWSAGAALADQCGRGIPSQLPDFSPILQGIFGVGIPAHLAIEVDPFAGASEPVANPSLIWDFDGSLGLIEADGVSDPHNNSDGVARRWACDVRFMTGLYQNRDGRKQRGTFCFL